MNVTKLDKDELSKPLVNRVANSGLITLNLEKYLPKQKILELDIKDFLFRELILKEQEFREKVAENDWSVYADKPVALFCSTDAIIQQWAYMLIVDALAPFTNLVYFGNEQTVKNKLLVKSIQAIDGSTFENERVIVKGCGNQPISDEAYLEITKHLLPVVKSLMFGEACSTVPIYKKKK